MSNMVQGTAKLLLYESFVALLFLKRYQGFWRVKANCGIISGLFNELICFVGVL